MSSPKKPLILCVDDEPSMRRLLTQVLNSGGYEVMTADSGDGALSVLQQAKPDLIVLDIQMPGMDGYQLCAQLQKNEVTAQIPVVFVTVLTGEENKARALALGGVAYVAKPFSEESLLPVIQARVDALPRWKGLRKESIAWDEKIHPADFTRFKEHLCEILKLPPEKKARLAKVPPARIYVMASEMGIASGVVAEAIAKFLKLAYVPRINPESIRLGILQPSFCKTHQVVPASAGNNPSAFVLSNPFNWDLLDILKKLSGQPPVLIITEPENIETLLKSGAASPPVDADANADFNLMTGVEPEGQAEIDAAEEYEVLNPSQMAKIAKLPPIIRLINMILTDAVKAGASDIHVEPQEDVLQVRFRVDGALVDSLKVPKHLQPNVISRFKIIARLDIAEHRKPQDGRSRLRFEDQRIDLRVSTLPAQFGEKVVIRLLDSAKARIHMDQLGMEPDLLARFQRLLSNPQGMILVTGPTGSGKTSTLYAALNWLKTPTKNIITVEDPIEFQVPGLTQVQIDTKTGMTFAAGLRSILRQDPNIILVGEVRDPETASIALEAAQTGHLLLSTLHTNDATSTITRLLDLGIEPFKVASSVIGILAQRLVRRVCPDCAIEREPSPEAVEKAGGRRRMPTGARWKASVGCAACQQMGFKGRLAIHELLEITEDIRDMIAHRAPDHAIREAARRSGGRGLMEDGIAKAAQGLTTLDEVLRVAPREDATATKSDAAAPAPGLSEARSTGQPARATSPKAAGKDKVSILVLEDDQDTQALLKRLLESGGYETTLAGDGIEALMHLGKKDFALILSDITMPNLDGIQLLEMNNKKGIKTPIIFLTAHADEAVELKGLELGAADFLIKPIKKEVLLLRVKKVLERHFEKTVGA
jgi:type II secretory ATPase GspE/PulE/Tfp pilus assembly ATPase PilB-like protein/DNA-binding response OmpR family regulator